MKRSTDIIKTVYCEWCGRRIDIRRWKGRDCRYRVFTVKGTYLVCRNCFDRMQRNDTLEEK
jgi:hypothetical protein